MVYNLLRGETLNKEFLTQDDDFLLDANVFLRNRAGYEKDDLKDGEAVYDAFLEHFRKQNANEVTAVRDMMYAQNASAEEKQRMGRLMETFDKMDSISGVGDVGKLVVDYAEGIATAPSTYAGLFTAGAAKAGTIAGTQGIKFGIKQALKTGGVKGALTAGATDAAIGAGSILAQEQTRVETGLQKNINKGNVVLGGALSAIPGAAIGAVAGTQRTIAENTAERIARITERESKRGIENAYKGATSKALKDTKLAKQANELYDKLKLDKAPLKETIPETLEKGQELKKAGLTLEDKQLMNIAVAASKVVSKIGPRAGVIEGSAEDLSERLVSRMARALNSEVVSTDTLSDIMQAHKVTMDDIASIYAAEISESGRLLGQAGQISKKLKKNTKKEMLKELSTMDSILLEQGQKVTSAARRRVEEELGTRVLGLGTKTSSFLKNLPKARVGLMTIQLATTARNTTNGYMRNFLYGMDNLGAGLYNVTVNSLKNPTDAMLKQEAKEAVKLGQAQLRAGYQSLLMKDIFFGMSGVEARALTKLMTDERFGKSELGKQIFRSMGDIAEHTGQEGGILGLARKFNYLNTQSDNMFKRAIFAREVDKALYAKDGSRLKDVLVRGKFSDIDDKVIGNAMTEALEFTYQAGQFKGRKGMTNEIFDTFIRASQTGFGSTFVPFPKYLVNQFRFVHEHAPLLGMVNFGGILNKPGKEGTRGIFGTGLDVVIDAESVGKQLGGLVVLGAMYGLRDQFGDASLPSFHYYDPTTQQVIDARASLGPFSAYALTADIIWRRNNLSEQEQGTKPLEIREFLEALGGGQFRPGTGLDIVDKIAEIASNSYNAGESNIDIFRIASDFLGQYVGSYFVGAGVIKDVVTVLDDDFRKVPNNQDVDLWQHFWKQSTKSFPQTTDPNAEGLFGGYTGIGPQRDLLQSPTRSGGIRTVDPFLRQLTGLNFKQERNIVETEFDRLRFDYREITPRRIKGDPDLSNKAKGEMASLINNRVASFINSKDYKDLPDDLRKRIAIKPIIRSAKSEARARVLNLDNYKTPEDFNQIARAKFLDLDKDTKALVVNKYKEQTGEDIYDKEDYEYGLFLSKQFK
jgi:hypothetical protein